MTGSPRPVPPPLDALLAQRAWVAALARRLTSDDDAAGEIEQRTWLAAIERPPSHADSPRGWLATALRNAARKLGRSETRRAAHETAALPRADIARDPAELVAEAEIQQLVGRLVLELAEPDRATLLARFFDGLAPSEIARREGVPAATVRSRIHRALARLREQLDREHPGGRREWTALLLLRFGDASRDPVPAPVQVSGPSVATAAAGGMLMSAKKGIVACVVLALVAGAGWLGLRTERTQSGAETAPSASATAADRGTASRPQRAATDVAADAEPSPRPPETGALPPPVDVGAADRDLDLAGIVVRADGSPVAGADVRSVRHPFRTTDVPILHWYSSEESGPSARTAADGTFSLRLDRAEVVTLRVSAAGLATSEFAGRVAGGRVRLVLAAGVRLRLVATLPEGAPAAGLALHVTARGVPPGGTASADVLTDATGSAIADGLPAGARAVVLANGREAARTLTEVALPDAGEAEHRFVVDPGRTFRGRVTDADTAAPVANAIVGFGFFRNPEVRTDADGRYVLGGCEPRWGADIAVVADGFASALVHAQDGDTVDVALRRGYGARGRVVGNDGRPVGGAQVAAAGSAFREMRQVLTTAHAMSAPDGTFALTGLDPDLAAVLVVVAPGHARTRVPITPASRGAVLELGDIRFGRSVALEGRVVERDGRALEGVPVFARGPDADGADENPYGRSVSRFTDDLGRFRFPDLPAGVWRLEAELPDGRNVEGAAEIGPAVPAHEAVLRVRASRALVVTAVDESGAPVQGALVGATGRSESYPDAATGPDGRVSLALGEGRWTLRFGWPGRGRPLLAPDEIEADAGTDVRLVFREGAWLRVRLVGPDGRAIAGAMVAATVRGGIGVSSGRTDAEGRCALVVARDAVCDVRFDGAGGSPWDGLTAAATGLVAGTEHEMRAMRVESGRTLRVRVFAPGGEPAAGVVVRLFSARGPAGRAATDAEGVAAFAELASRATTVNVTAPVGLAAPSPQSVVPAGQTIDIRLRATTPLRGRVLRADGSIPARAFVTVLDGRRLVATTFADGSGRFAAPIPIDEAGPFRLVAGLADTEGDEDAGTQSPRGTLENVERSASDVDIRLDR